ncbi:MAG: YdeI/OmpD-associated family protein [Gemmatimonadaceae bacterium]
MGKKDPRVDAYIAQSADFAKPILIHIREVVHSACPDVEETLKWRLPTFMHQGIMCGMAAFKEHAAFNLWKGSLIVGSDGDRDAMGQFGRITKLSDLPSKRVLAGYIKQAMALNEAGVKTPKIRKPGLERKPVLKTPPDFAAALKKNSKARATFEGFSPSKRKEYVEWIVDAKRDETRQRRISEAVGMLAEGRTRNWKYS